MKSYHPLILCLTLLLIFIGSENVASAQRLRIGIGARPCTEYISESTNENESNRKFYKMVAISWLQGYLMGMNTVQSALAPEKGMKVIPDMESLHAELFLQCQKEPSETIIGVSTGIFVTLPDVRK
jgi:hypothetical protein